MQSLANDALSVSGHDSIRPSLNKMLLRLSAIMLSSGLFKIPLNSAIFAPFLIVVLPKRPNPEFGIVECETYVRDDDISIFKNDILW